MLHRPCSTREHACGACTALGAIIAECAVPPHCNELQHGGWLQSINSVEVPAWPA
jgi:hypothetical protein